MQLCTGIDAVHRLLTDKAKKDGKYELVIELYDDGMPIEKIAKLSKMTFDEVKEIVERHPKI